MDENDNIIEVFSGTQWEADLLRSIFSDHEIQSFIRNKTLRTNLLDPIIAEGVKIMIFKRDLEKAEKIINTYFKNKKF